MLGIDNELLLLNAFLARLKGLEAFLCWKSDPTTIGPHVNMVERMVCAWLSQLSAAMYALLIWKRDRAHLNWLCR